MSNSPFDPGARIVIYLRDSGGEEQELSVLQQKKELTAWAEQEGLTISHSFADTASPGSSTVGREEFHAMLRHFKTGAEESGVLIWKFSRFARNIDDAQFYRADLRRRGYIVHSLHDNVPIGADGRLFEAAIDWMNERFLIDLSEDVKRGLRYNVLQHKAIPGNPPKGFMRVPLEIGTRRDGSPHIVNQWQADPALIPIIRKAFELRADGHTYRSIEKEIGLFRAKNSYTTFFRNKIYTGIMEYGDLVIEDFCDPIVPRKTWDAVQRIARRRKDASTTPTSENPRRVGSAYLLSGLAYCQMCGSPLNAHTIKERKGGRREYYACSRRKRRGDCTARHIPRLALENAVRETLRDQALSPENLLHIQTEMQHAWQEQHTEDQSLHEEHTRKLKQIEKETANLTQAIASSGHSRALLVALSKLEAKEDEISAALSRAEDTRRPKEFTVPQLKELAAQMEAALKSENTNEQRLALRSLVTRVTIRRDEQRLVGVLYYMPREFVYLRVVPPQGNKPEATQSLTISAIIPRKKYTRSSQ